MLFSRCLDGTIENIVSDAHFHIQQTYSIQSTLIHGRFYIFINYLIDFRNRHASYLAELVLFDSFANFFFNEEVLLFRRQVSQFYIGLFGWDFLYIFFHEVITICNINLIMLNIVRQAPAFIYDLFISTFFTIAAHLVFIDYMHLSSGNFLDIGCGTGKPLFSIIKSIKKFHSKIIGVDLHPQYAEKAMKLFKGDETVQIYNLDFYKIQAYLQLKFRFVFFSFSFMLFPNQLEALEIAKSILDKHQSSRVAFVLTLNKNKNSFVSKIKPIIKRFTTIDFGNVVYQQDFRSLIDEAGLQILKFTRVKSLWNVFLWISPVYYVECRVKNLKQ